MDNINIDLDPEWLLTEVLLRLPPASLCRFKAVSKQWHSLILSPYFSRTYASRASTSPRWTLLSGTDYDRSIRRDVREHKLLMDLHSGDLKCPISNQPNDQNLLMKFYRVLGVSNGLILCRCFLYNLRDRKYCQHRSVCNPVTKQCFVLPSCISIPRYHKADGWGFLTEVQDGVVTSYTVVAYVAALYKFAVFFSKTGEWKVYTVPTNIEINSTYLELKSTDLDGILHWMHPITGLIAYDPHRNPNGLRVIAFPSRTWRSGQTGMCCTHKGHLRILYSDAESLSIWVLNDYGCGDNWLLQHRIDYVDIMQDVHYSIKRLKITIKLEPISFHPFDTDIVYMGCDQVFVSYNMRERKLHVLKSFRTSKLSGRYYHWRHAFSFVIPPFPVSLPSSPSRE